MLSLAEELLLLALDDDKGTVSWRVADGLSSALAGAVLAELALRERIALDGKNVVIHDPSPSGDGVLDEALALLAAAKHPRDPTHWVDTFRGHSKRLRERLEDRLVEQGILRREEHRVLRVFTLHRYPEANPALEQELRQRIRRVVLDGAAPEPRTTILISLAKAAGLLDGVFAATERRRAGTCVEDLVMDEQLGKAAAPVAAAAAAADAARGAIAAMTAAASSG